MKRSRNDSSCAEGNLPTYVIEAIDELGGLENLAKSVPPMGDIMDQMKVHKALSNEARLTILWSVRCCDMCPCVLKEFLKVGDSTISYHLSLLEEAGLITGRQEKNWRIFSITERGRKVLSCWPPSRK